MKIKYSTKLLIILVLGAGLFLRLALFRYGTYELDFNTFVAWSNSLKEVGFSKFYGSSWSDYLPGYLYILRLLANIGQTSLLSKTLIYKLPAMISDLITGYFIYLIVRKKNPKWAVVASAFYVFNPAIIVNSTLWGQVDSITALCALLSIYFLEDKWYLSSFFLAAGTLFKPQVAFIAPLILFIMFKKKFKFKVIISYILLSLSVFVLGFAPFNDNQNIIYFIQSRLGVSANQYPFSSVNAFNFWGLGGFWRRDDTGFLNAKLFGYLISGILILILLIKYLLNKAENEFDKYKLAAGIFLITFLFLTRIHERHMLPLFGFASILLVDDLWALVIYLGYSITYVFNLIYAYNYISADHGLVLTHDSTMLLILVNLVLFILFLGWYFKKLKPIEEFFAKIIPKENSAANKFEGGINKSKVKGVLLGIIIFTFIVRIIGLGSPPTEYFDEVYHAFTAKKILEGDPKAWEWWNPNPKGFAYEWTHPPVAKLGMVAGMKLFGENSFGWRTPGVILGVGTTLLVFLLSKEIFEDNTLAIIASAVYSLDGLNLVLSRTGMNDIYFLFFSLLCLYLFIKEKYFFSALSFGVSIASKWSAIWLVPVLLISIFVFRKKLKLSLLWFLVIPVTVYLASYSVMFATGHTFSQFIEVQRQMWWYHTNLKATHAYSSLWWSWPFDLRPVYFYTSEEVKGWVARIYVFGNPLISWFGILATALSFYYGWIKKNRKLGFVIFAYLIFFVPWAVSPRIMFYYHYLPSTPFLAILIAWILRSNKKLIAPMMAIFLISFLYFYPHFVGLQVPLWLDHSYYWLSSWR